MNVGTMACMQGSHICPLLLLIIATYSNGLLNDGAYELSEVSTASLTTPPDGMSQWQVKDGKGRVCMLMEMNGIIFDGIATTPIPQSAKVTNRTSCDSENNSVFELEWSENNFITNGLRMHFRVRHGNYTVIKLVISRKVLEGIHLIFIQRPRRSPTVPVGTAMRCTDLNFDMVGFEEFRFQPFARISNGTFGKDGGCYLVHVTRPGVYVGVSILVLVVFVVVFYVVYKVIQKWRTRRRNKYQQI